MDNQFTAVNYSAHLQQQYNIGRRTLIGVIIMTLINLGLLLSNADDYLIFSASVPYYLTWLGKGMDNMFGGGLQMENGIYTLTGLIMGAVILVVYFVFWLLSKKNGRWLWAAVVMLCLDLAALVAVAVLVLGGIGSSVVDGLIHIVAIYQIGKGASSWKKLQEQPPEIMYTVVNDDL